MADEKDNVVNLEEIRKQIEQNTESVEAYTARDPYLERMNEDHAFIKSIGGKPMVSSYIYNEVFDKKILEFCTPESIIVRYSNEVVSEGRNKIELGRWWIKHAERKEYDTVIYDPSKPKEYKNCLNLWEGFAVEPKKGNWKYTCEHIYKILCNACSEKFTYVIKWLAWAVQNPGIPAGTVLVFKGLKGSGKGIILTQFIKIFGRHGMHISSREHLTGKFNGHLQMCSFLFSDEAYYPGDKEAEGTLKQLITEPSLTIEAKHRSPIIAKNTLHIAMATNMEWFIPATKDERRYFANKIDNKYAKDECDELTRKLYFSRISVEMNNGGREAMLYDLLNMELFGWTPLFNVPETEEIARQKIMSLGILQTSMLTILQDGVFPGEPYDTGSFKVNATEFYEFLGKIDPKCNNFSSNKKADLIKELGAIRGRNARGIIWNFPALKTMRENWDKLYGTYKWDKQEEWQVIKGMY